MVQVEVERFVITTALARGFINKQQLEQAAKNAKQKGTNVTTTLCEMGFISKQQLKNLTDIGTEAASWPEDARKALAEDPKAEFDTFVKVKILGRGGMGTVFKCWDKALKRYVAIKVIDREVDQESALRFIAEARAGAKLRHPNIIGIYGLVEPKADKQPYIVMEFVDGKSLEEIAMGLDLYRKLSIVKQIALALDYAHSEGVLHRDVKPSNIMLNGKGTPYLMDFGIAKIQTEKTMTQTGVTVGTPAFMSPEQATGQKEKMTKASDIFSLGATLYWLLTDETPYQGDSVYEVCNRAAECKFKIPSQINPNIPPTLEKLVLRAMNKNPAFRFLSGQQFAAAIDKAIEELKAAKVVNIKAAPSSGKKIGTKSADPKSPKPGFRGSTKAPSVRRLRSVSGALKVVIALVVVGAIATIVVLTSRSGSGKDKGGDKTKEQTSEIEQKLSKAEKLLVSNPSEARKLVNEVMKSQPDNQKAMNILSKLDTADKKAKHIAQFRESLAADRKKALEILADLQRMYPGDKDVRALEDEITAAAEKERLAKRRELIEQFKRNISSDIQKAYDALFELSGMFPNDKEIESLSEEYEKVKAARVEEWDEKTLTGHTGKVTSIKLSPNGKSLVSICEDKTIRIWGLPSGNELRNFTPGDSMSGVAISPDGKMIATGGVGKVILWDFLAGKAIKALPLGKDWIVSVALSSDGKYVVCGGYDMIVRLVDWNSGEAVKSFYGHTGKIHSVAVSGDGKRIASGAEDKSVRIWDVESEKELKVMTGHSGSVHFVAYSPDYKYLASCSEDFTLKVWDAASGTEVKSFSGHTAHTHSAVFTPDGKYVISGSGDKTMKIWELSTGAEAATIQGNTGHGNSLVLSHDGKFLIASMVDGTIKILKLSKYTSNR